MQWHPHGSAGRCAWPNRQQRSHASHANRVPDDRRAGRCVCRVARVVCTSLIVQTLSACATPAGGWFQLGPHPAALAGVWVDPSKATPTDTVAWVLTPTGEDRTRIIHVEPLQPRTTGPVGRRQVKRQERRHGSWYLSGVLGDTSSQAICVKRRARDGASCASFRLDTLPATAGTHGRRRLRIVSLPRRRDTPAHVFLELR